MWVERVRVESRVIPRSLTSFTGSIIAVPTLRRDVGTQHGRRVIKAHVYSIPKFHQRNPTTVRGEETDKSKITNKQGK